MTDIDKLKIPLIVGVSGHIDITTPESVLQDALTEFWTQLRQTIGPETPIVLLSSIARGADHLMVKYRPADVPYCAVLPFDSKEYEKDFTGQALDDYRADLAGAYKCITCSADAGDYTLASDYVRTHSDILVTFWDGFETLDQYGLPQKGGTYYLLRKIFKFDDLLISKPEKAHIAVNIPVERQKVHREDERQLLSEKNWGTLIWNAKENPQITPGLSLNDHPNLASNIAFIQRHNCSLPDKVEKKSYLYNCIAGSFPDQYQVIAGDYIRYDYLDQIAVNNQKKHKFEFILIGILSILAGIASQFWGGINFQYDISTNEAIIHWIIFAHCLSFIVAIVYYKLAVRKSSHYQKYIQPRVIAELLRLKMFWKLSAIREDFFDDFLKDSANFQITLPICNWEAADPAPTDAENAVISEEIKSGFPTVCRCWIEDQKSFYQSYIPDHLSGGSPAKAETSSPAPKNIRSLIKKWRKYLRPYHRRTIITLYAKNIMFALTIAFSVGLLIKYFTYQQEDIFNLSCYREFVVGICPFIVALLGWLMEKSNWDIIGRRYRELYQMFTRAIAKMPNLKEPESKQKLIKELMFLCRQENTEWESIRNASQPEPML